MPRRKRTPIADTLGPRLAALAARRFPPPPGTGRGPRHLPCDVYALADAAGVEKTNVYRIIAGKASPSFTTLEKLCLACDATVADLYDVEPGG